MNQTSPSTVFFDTANVADVALTPRPSACPGLLRIVAARDGGICRIKLPGGELSAQQARSIAEVSERHAAGVIELTNRANLQLRGVKHGEEAALIAALVDAGLGPALSKGADGAGGANGAGDPNGAGGEGDANRKSDANNSDASNANGARSANGAKSADPAAATASPLSASAADDLRNVMISPTAGLDPYALLDTRPLCAELLAMLQSEARFAALSPKFALLVDGGERLARTDHPHDVWLAASHEAEGVRFVFGLAGCPPTNEAPSADSPTENGHATAKHPDPDGSCALAAIPPSQACALVRALLLTFLDLADAQATRMRDLLAAHSVDTVLHHAQRYLGFPLTRDMKLAAWRRSHPADASRRLGAHPQRLADTWHVGGQPTLGRLDADTLDGLAALAQRHGNGTLRVTPWQSVLLPDVPTHAVAVALSALDALGLACDPAQAVTSLIACAGSPGCAKSLADTKADALRLASRLPADVDAHLSGCPRSCAAAHCAPYTLLAVLPGRYDLYRRDGRPGFGQCVARQLTIDQAADTLERLARSNPNA